MVNKNNMFLIGWIVGLIEGEGNFSVEITKASDMKLQEKVQQNFNVTQHWVNESILYILLDYFKCGHVNWNNKKTEVRQFRVRSFNDLSTKIIPFFSS